MTAWLSNLRDLVRTRLWPVPAAAVVAALLLGLGLPRLDSAVDGRLSTTVGHVLFGGDSDAARSLLGVIGTSMITVTSLTFSLTVVTLQLASSQFSPRLLRTFTRDRFVQATLALFLATFTYALTVLRAVRSPGDNGQREFVPQIAVTVAFVLAVASVLGLVLFLAHLSEQIRVETMLRNVHRDASHTMDDVLPMRDGRAGPPAPEEHAGTTSCAVDRHSPSDELTVLARDDGFLNWVNEDKLLTVATDEDVLVVLDVHPGMFLVRGTPVGVVRPLVGGRLEAEPAVPVTESVARCLHAGIERTAAQDVGYGLRQLVDVANKALSPGINDPTTAIHALGHISAFLCDLADRDLGDKLLHDETDRVRVVLRRPDLAAYVDLGISQPRRYGAEDPQVLQRILAVLLDLSHRVTPAQQSVVSDQLRRLQATVRSQPFDQAERAGLARLGKQVEENLQPLDA